MNEAMDVALDMVADAEGAPLALILNDCQRNYWEALAEGSLDSAAFWLKVEALIPSVYSEVN